MRILQILKISTIFFLLAALEHSIFYAKVSAASEETFHTVLKTSYTVEQTGLTKVEHQYTITNRTPTTYIKQYALKTSYKQLTDIKVNSGKTTLQPNVATTDQGTSIGFSFPDEVVGEDKQRVFSISYATADIAVVGGKALEIHIPRMTDSESYNEIQIEVRTPREFGSPVRSTGQIVDSKETPTQVVTQIATPSEQSLSLFFGSEQYYFLSLRYHLDNSTSTSGITQVSLPPDTSFQKLHYHTIDPLPEKLDRDPDGNWIATYTLPPTSNTSLLLTAVARVTLEPDSSFPLIPPGKKHQQPQEYWETSQTIIKEKAQNFNSAKSIYDFVTNTLTYTAIDFQSKAPERKGAAKALQHPEDAVCQEFTDVFVALSRANNIPARRLTGYAYTRNSQLRPLSFAGDVLHAWPDFFNAEKQVWQPVDPTWGHTTKGVNYFDHFDLNHIVFAINGISSTIPYPAGAYKSATLDSKDIEVSFAQEFPERKPEFLLTIRHEALLGINLPGRYVLELLNQSGQAWYDIDVEFALNSVSLGKRIENLPYILPFQVVKIPVVLPSDSWLSSKQNDAGTVTIRPATQPDTILYARTVNNLTTSPKILSPFTSFPLALSVGSCLVIFTLTAGSILVFKRKKRSSVRR
ncbi:transglutaminase domain-containing protein [Candidatus Woesebacteria bacterium]|nr:transglutaminase domain-containing protein [Candidatus Woesebacteria bacterium]